MAITIKHIDTLDLLCGNPIQITSKIIYNQPHLRDVIRVGEREYYQVLSDLTAIPSDMKSVLWDAGLDWMQVDDMELFAQLSHNIGYEKTSLFFPNVDFSKFALLKSEDEKILLYDQENDIKIDFYVFSKMQECLCKSHSITKKVEKAGNIYTKKVLIEEDRQNRELNKGKEYKSQLASIVSAMVNWNGFKYNYETVWDLTMYQFMDAVSRVKIIDSTTHLLNGIYAGTVDASKIKSDKMSWMREVNNEE